VAVSLFALTPPRSDPGSREEKMINWFGEKEFQKSCQLFGKTLFYQV
jgi:hypothetical protein